MRDMLEEYLEELERAERCASTRAQYEWSVRRFLAWAGERELTKELVIAYKEELRVRRQPGRVNGALAALNGYFA